MPDVLSQKFAALADPTRRALLARLSKGRSTVTDLAKPFLHEMSLPAVTKHLQVLERAKLITKSRDAQRRPCQLNGQELRDVASWMEQYRVFWEESFDRLGEYLKTVTDAGKKGAPISPPSPSSTQAPSSLAPWTPAPSTAAPPRQSSSSPSQSRAAQTSKRKRKGTRHGR